MMNNELRPYENYKSIDLPWLNSIPEHWIVSRNKNMMFQAKSLVGGNHHNYKLLSLTLNGVIARDMVNPKGKFPKEFDTYQIVNQKDLVFCLFDIDETPRTVGISPLDGMITGAYIVFNVKSANERYVYYYYLALDNNKMLKPLYTGLRKVISADTFLRTKLPIPPRLEQDQIVKYLDHQLTKINKFIKAKKKLIAVLKEQKQAIINEAVTKGLDPNVKMKPSGIEWIGEVPEHWEIKTIKHVAKLMNGKNYNVVNDGNVPVYGSGGKFAATNMVMHEGPSVLLGRKGTIDKPLIVNEPFWCVDTAFYIESFRNVLLEYFYFYSLIIDYNRFSSKTALPSMTQTTINNIKIIIPNINEQSEIVEFIIGKTYLIDRNIDLIENEIKLVNEYKNSLISDVVTGKVDVRNIIIEELEEEIIEDIELEYEAIDKEILEVEDGDE